MQDAAGSSRTAEYCLQGEASDGSVASADKLARPATAAAGAAVAVAALTPHHNMLFGRDATPTKSSPLAQQRMVSMSAAAQERQQQQQRHCQQEQEWGAAAAAAGMAAGAAAAAGAGSRQASGASSSAYSASISFGSGFGSSMVTAREGPAEQVRVSVGLSLAGWLTHVEMMGAPAPHITTCLPPACAL